MRNYSIPLCLVVALFSLFFSINTFALSCKTTDGGLEQHIELDHEIKVSTANLKPGTVLWRSQNFTSTFVCEDTNDHPQGEYAYLYFDPDGLMQSIDDSIEVGVTYLSEDIESVKGAKRQAGKDMATGPGRHKECGRRGCKYVADSQKVTVTYSIYIKARGGQPPSDGRIHQTGSYAVFQVDGELGLNSTPHSNFRAYISGLGNIRFIACNPKITVRANNGETVDFGKIPARNAVAGAIEKQVPFSVEASLTDAGQDCTGQTLMASFSSPTARDSITIMPENISDSGYGIQLSSHSSPNTWIPMNTPTVLGAVKGSIVQNDYFASLVWLNSSPKIGPFKATANIDVTFK